jgi:hypothetical protein
VGYWCLSVLLALLMNMTSLKCTHTQAEFAEERGKYQTEITKLRNKASLLKNSDVKDRVYRPSLSSTTSNPSISSSSGVAQHELSKAYQEGTKAADVKQQQAISSYESRIQDLTAKVIKHVLTSKRNRQCKAPLAPDML